MDKRVVTLPMIALRGLTVLPEMVIHFDVSREKSLRAIEKAMEEDQKIFLSAQKEIDIKDPGMDEVYQIGCIATIKQVVKLPKKLIRVLITADERARILKFDTIDGALNVDVETVPDKKIEVEEEAKLTQEAMLKALKDLFQDYMGKNPKAYKELAEQVEQMDCLVNLVNTVAANLNFPYKEAQVILEETNVVSRYKILTERLIHEIQVQNIKDEIQAKVKERVDKNQREYILREEMKIIREELGDDHTISDADEFQRLTDSLDATDEVKEKINKEIKRFRNTMSSPSESAVIRTYIETMLDMPWEKRCSESKDIRYAKEILDEEHYGMEKIKERVLEYLAVRALTAKGDAPILCLVGPPGTGKTSIAKSLSKSLKKPYVRISLGGVRDEAEIRGHRKTYIGAMPGRIADAMKTAKVKNPLIILDEIDKVSNDYKGDTFSALLEVLDSEQNSRFRDHYLEVPLDLSEVFFITTANTVQTIPRPLLDRMEVIEVTSYTENEKLHIVQEHLLPKQKARHGLKEKQLSISKKAIWKMIRSYTKEAGVRQLERKIADVCRKSAREIFENKKKSIRVTERNLSSYLGKEIYSYQMANKDDEVGIVRGLAWTSVGGDTLQIEVNIMPGDGAVLLTGQMGDVMKESAKTGISYIRSISKEHKIDEKFFKEHDIHIHIPEGAVPKDGPSAGITMATAIYSAITEKKVRADVAMTGEITLRGRVLPIGGLKEKLLAAKSAGIKLVMVPEKNIPDIQELSEEITKGLEIVPVSHMDEVLKIAIAKKKN